MLVVVDKKQTRNVITANRYFIGSVLIGENLLSIVQYVSTKSEVYISKLESGPKDYNEFK